MSSSSSSLKIASCPGDGSKDTTMKQPSEFIRPTASSFGVTPAASAFPPAVSDYYQLDELLTPEEKNLQIKVRQFMENEVAPIIPKYWETAEFPFHLIPKLGSLGFFGGTIKGHGCPGLSATAHAVCLSEVARVDGSMASFCLAQSCLAMLTIAQLGSEAQKDKYLPALSRQHKVIAYAWITKQARETVALGRELLGGNGIVTDFHVGKAFCDMETVYTYDGTYEINTLIAAREITGISSIKPAVSRL